MEIFAQGTDVVLDIFIYDREGGVLVDPDNYPTTEPTVTVKDQNGITVISNQLVSQPYADGTGRISEGHYSMKYHLEDDAPIGNQWRFIWSLTVNSVVLPENERTEYFEVVEAGYISFAGFITVEEVRNYMEGMGIDSSILSDNFIKMKIKSEIAKAERLTGGKSFFVPKEETIYLSGDGSRTIQLPNWPVESITSIQLLYTGDLDITLNDNEYILNGRAGQVSILSTVLSEGTRIFQYPEGQNNILVTYKHGYSNVPDDVKDALIQLIVVACLQQLSSRGGGAASLSIEGYSKTYDKGGQYQSYIKQLASGAKNTLKMYRSLVRT